MMIDYGDDYKQITDLTTGEKVKLHDQLQSYKYQITCAGAPQGNECVGQVTFSYQRDT